MVKIPAYQQDEDESGAAQEIANGRLAMWAVGGIAMQSVISGHSFPYV